MPEDDRWRRGKIKGSFNEQGADRRADKPGLSREFNKQDRERIAASKLERLQDTYSSLSQNLNKSSKPTPRLEPKGNMRKIRDSVNKREQARHEQKVKTRMKQIKEQIRQQKRVLKKDRER